MERRKFSREFKLEAVRLSGRPPEDAGPAQAISAAALPKQPQPAPGLAREMDPKPDHGEESYKGSGAGRKALITGGNSGIGRAAAIAYAREGADVAIGYP